MEGAEIVIGCELCPPDSAYLGLYWWGLSLANEGLAVGLVTDLGRLETWTTASVTRKHKLGKKFDQGDCTSVVGATFVTGDPRLRGAGERSARLASMRERGRTICATG